SEKGLGRFEIAGEIFYVVKFFMSLAHAIGVPLGCARAKALLRECSAVSGSPGPTG
ncbi:MAG: hypothetical protein ACI9QL_004009, partial [Candidatus Omnitrophota bacterium]